MKRSKSLRGVGEGKSPWMWSLILLVWLLSLVTLRQTLLSVVFGDLNFLQRIALLYFLCWIAFAWLFSLYRLAIVLVNGMTARLNPCYSGDTCESSTVAILYTTKNDFSSNAVLSCMNQTFPRTHVFLLDDSTDPRYREQIDRFHAEHPSRATVLRRYCRQGYKAGNLNHALQQISAMYDFFAICDADGILPPDFVSKGLTYFTTDNVGFVQAIQRPALLASSQFTSDLEIETTIYWDHVVPASQKFGFVLFHGHGGLIRTKLWREIGGFPLVVAEDLAFSTLARQYGYRGVIAPDLVCYEEFPASYEAFAKRYLKYSRGAAEHLKKGMWAFLRSRRVKWFEKIDRLMASLAMVSALPLMVFLLDFAFLFSQRWVPSLHLTGIWGVTTPFMSSSNPNAGWALFDWMFYIMTVSALFLPLAPMLCHLWKRPRAFSRHLICSVAAHLSLVVYAALETISVLALGKNSFPVTGEQTQNVKLTTSSGKRKVFNTSVMLVGNCSIVVALTAFCNLGSLPISLATVVGLVVQNLGWGHWAVRMLMPLPALSVVTLAVLGCPGLVSSNLFVPLGASPL